jgi:hypothetical protein
MQTRDDIWVSWMTLQGRELPKNHYPPQTWGIIKEEEQEVVKCKQNFAVSSSCRFRAIHMRQIAAANCNHRNQNDMHITLAWKC